MSNYIGAVISSYTASSLLSNTSSPNWLSSSSALKSNTGLYGSNFATIASDYKALQTRKYDTLSSSYSYLKTVTSADYATESQSSTEKAKADSTKATDSKAKVDSTKATTEAASKDKTIKLSANQMSTVYGKYSSNARLLDMLV